MGVSLSKPQSIGMEQAAARGGWRVIAVATAVFALLWLYAAVSSEGFIEADARTHYLSARFALSQPHRLISVWDRPLFMLLYSVPAATLGVMGTRTVSLIMAIACAWTAWRIAARLGMRRPEWAYVITLGSPLLYLHSFSEMTELCFAALTGAGSPGIPEPQMGADGSTGRDLATRPTGGVWAHSPGGRAAGGESALVASCHPAGGTARCGPLSDG